jgi:hypothetical protein
MMNLYKKRGKIFSQKKGIIYSHYLEFSKKRITFVLSKGDTAAN